MIEAMLLAVLALQVLLAAGFAVAMLRVRTVLRRLSRRIDGRAGGPAASAPVAGGTGLDRWFERTAWPQIEALTSIYRLLDGKPFLPITHHWAASPDFLMILLRHIERHRPRVIVECGSGTSTVAMAAALRALGIEGHIHSIENHPRYAEQTRQNLLQQGLEAYATVVVAPLEERRYRGYKQIFNWYGVEPDGVPDGIDLLVIDGPDGGVNRFARYPAGPELFPKLSRDAHIFLDDAARNDERALIAMWRKSYPDLGARSLVATKGAVEMFFLDRKIEDFLPPHARRVPTTDT